MRRLRGEPCPIPANPAVSMELCSPCDYFRGATSVTGRPITVICNWPRNGSEVWQDPDPPTLTADQLARLMAGPA